MKRPGEYILVHWEDISTHEDGWVDLEEMQARRAINVFSVGWAAREDNTHLYIVMDWCDGEGNTIGKIPKAAIRSLKKVKLRGFPPREKEKSPQNADNQVVDGFGEVPLG
jgi:hypothetical protein